MSTRNESYNPLLKSYVDSEKVNSVSEGAENLYVRLIAQSDDAGRYSADPQWVLAKLYTQRMFAGLTVAEVASRLVELEQIDLLRFYEVGGKRFLQLVNVFRTHRKDVKRKLVWPEPLSEPVTDPLRTRNGHVTHPLRTRDEHVTLEPDLTLTPDQAQEPAPTPEPDQAPEVPTEPLSKPSAIDRADEVRRVFDHYRASFPKRFPRPNSSLKEWKLIRARLAEGSTVDDLCDAIDGMMRSPWHQGHNDRQKAFDSLELVVRDAKHVHDFQAIPARAGPVLSDKTRKSIQARDNVLDRLFPEGEPDGDDQESAAR